MDQFAITAYNRAIQLIMKEYASSKARLYISLIVCALFVCLEFLQGNVTGATTHIEGGISMLSEWRRNVGPPTSSESRLSSVESSSTSSSDSQGSSSSSISATLSELDLMRTLTAVFSRLRLQSGVFGKAPRLKEVAVESTPERGFHFENMAEARDANVDLMNESISFIMTTSPAKYTNTVTPEMVAHQRRLQLRFQDWRRAIDVFLKGERRNLEEIEAKGTQILICHNTCCYIWTSTCLSPEESQYDKYKAQFEEMVKQCSYIADVPTISLCRKVGRFHFDMGLLAPLHFIGSRCRWPQIRKACLKILGSYRWREGLFDSYRSYRYIKAIMDLEETEKLRLLGLAASESDSYLPPEGARIHFAELGPSDTDSHFQVYTFFTKRFGPLGDWYMQKKSISTSSKSPDTDVESELEPQSAYIAFVSEKGPVVVPKDSSTEAFADRSNGMFYYHLAGSQVRPLKQTYQQPADPCRDHDCGF